MKKQHLKMAEHAVLGEKLRIIRNTLASTCVVLGNRYTVNGKEYRLAEKAMRAVDKLRSHLDSVVHVDCPPETDHRVLNHLYYTSEDGRSVTLKPEVGDGSWILRRTEGDT